jgi:hypothetical protein
MVGSCEHGNEPANPIKRGFNILNLITYKSLVNVGSNNRDKKCLRN